MVYSDKASKGVYSHFFLSFLHKTTDKKSKIAACGFMSGCPIVEISWRHKRIFLALD
jgi:hypothetical protein